MTRLLSALGLAFLLLLSPAAGLVVPLAPAHAAAPVPASETPLQAAQASLAKGDGPAHGQALTCTGTGALTDGCSAGPAVTHAPSSAIGWQKLCSYNSCPPPGRGGAGMTYDPLTGYVVLFGGIKNLTTASGTTYNDTWIFQDGNWTPLHIPGPTPRLGQYMAYDYADHYVVMFGGGPYLTLDSTLYFHDTWTFQNGTWTELNLTTSPSARGLGGMAWDAADGYLLMYGGMTSPTDVHSDTWSFVGGQWHNLTASVTGHPPPLLAPGLTYDPQIGSVLVFGGASPVPGLQFGEDQEQTWSYVHGTWTNLTPAIHGTIPDGRILSSMAYDPVDGYVLLFGGWNTTTGALFGDTWAFANDQWTLYFLSPSPAAAIIGASMISTVPSSGLLLFGGIIGTYTSYRSTNATWVYGPAPYLVSTPYVVSVQTAPSSCGLEFNGTLRSSGANVEVLPGSYGTAARPCPGYTFSGWFTSGGVNVAGGTGSAVTVDVTGNGSVTAYFVPDNAGQTSYQANPVALGATVALLLAVVLVLFWAARMRPRPPRAPPPTAQEPAAEATGSPNPDLW